MGPAKPVSESGCQERNVEKKRPERALSPGTPVGECTVGEFLTANRQAIFYAGQYQKESVIIEEFFPPFSAARQHDGNGIGPVKNPEVFNRALELFRAAETPERSPLIAVVAENGTVYRIYRTEGEDAECLAERMSDSPVLFRDRNGKPLMTVTAMPFPELPPVRPYLGKGSTRTKSGRTVPWILIAVMMVIILGLLAFAIRGG